MAKMSVQWHAACLQNMRSLLEREELQLKEKEYRVRQLRRDCAFRARQIIEANRQGRDGFDSERFMVKKRRSA